MSVVVPIGGALALPVGLRQVIAGIGAVAGKRHTTAIAATAIGTGTVVTIPLRVLAAILLRCSREQFRDRSAMRRADT